MKFCKHRVLDRCNKDNRPCVYSKNCFEPEENRPMTNADRFRSMTDEELANSRVVEIRRENQRPVFFALGVTHKEFFTKEDAVKLELKWLQQPAEVT